MAQPSSSHHERRERERSHHRTVSSTTLLLTLSLILAVLAVLLSLPSRSNPSPAVPLSDADPASSGLWGYLTPKRSQSLVARESSVAVREAEVARREAEILAGSIGGVAAPTASAITCPACPTITETIETIIQAPSPHQTVYKEYFRDEALAPSGWSSELSRRIEDILDREAKIADREREIGRREESVNRREHDASRREGWIMEQLIALGNDAVPTVEEEFIYEPGGRKIKETPSSEFSSNFIVHTATQTVTVPITPANTRIIAEQPKPAYISSSSSPPGGPTSTVEITVNEHGDVLETRSDGGTVTVYRTVRPTSQRRPWFRGW